MPTQQTTTPKQTDNWQRPGAMPTPQSGRNRRPRVLQSFDLFWQRVTAGMELTELWSQFKRDAQSGYKFYQRDFDLEGAPGQPKGRAFLQRIKAFMPRIRDTMRSGWKGSSASYFSPTPMNLMGAPVT